jgi:hypothetical protein
VFAGSADFVTVWFDLIVLTGRAYSGFDLVGYELDANLEAALTVGFVGVGPLRVWVR